MVGELRTQLRVNVGTVVPPALLKGPLLRFDSREHAKDSRRFHGRGLSELAIEHWRLSAAKNLAQLNLPQPVEYFVPTGEVRSLIDNFNAQMVKSGKPISTTSATQTDAIGLRGIDGSSHEPSEWAWKRDWVDYLSDLLQKKHVRVYLVDDDHLLQGLTRGSMTYLWLSGDQNVLCDCQQDQSITIKPDVLLEKMRNRLLRSQRTPARIDDFRQILRCVT